MNLIKIFIVYIALLLNSIDGFSQDNLVVVHQGDSTIKATIVELSRKIKVLSEKNYFYFYQGQIKSTTGDFLGHLLNGSYRVFDVNDNLLVSGSFSNGVKNGLWKFWNKDGRLLASSKYKNGLIHGKQITYDSNGLVSNVDRYKEGELRIGSKFSKYVSGLFSAKK